MQILISQLLLPLVLGSIMFGLGMSLTPHNFTQVLHHKKSVALGLSMQLFLLPSLAILIGYLFSLAPVYATGLFLLALCPGGATSNLFTFLSRGDLALSVSLTAITSFLSPFLLPLFFLFYLAQTQFIDAAHHFTIPILPTMLQLMLVTILPLGLGMMTRQFAPDFAQRVQPWVKKGASMAMVIIVLSLIVTNQSVMKGVITSTGLAVIVMAFIAFVCGYGISKAAGLESSQRRTLAIEVGIQNAGTAMMVALTLLQQPELAFVPLMYGILMNVPAFAFAIWANMKTSSAGMSQTKMG